MIDIDIYKKNHRYSIMATGHARYAAHGYDIVCAAVSTLLQTYAFYLEKKEKSNGFTILEIKLESGDMNVEYLDFKDIYVKNFEMILIGLDALQDTYPGFIKLNKMLENENL
jgi:uncharacterized protein YsxB (DUF464 family)